MQNGNTMELQQSDRLIGDEKIDGTVKNFTYLSVFTLAGPSNPESLFTALTATQRSPRDEAVMMIEERDTCLTPAS